MAATTTCPVAGDLRVWVYVSTWAGTDYGPYVRRDTPPFECLGAAQAVAAGVDPLVAVTALMQRDWKSFALPAPVVSFVPQPYAVAGAKTRFSAPEQHKQVSLPPVDLLGLSVTLRLTAVSYDWQFGDGERLRAAAAGDGPLVEHVYRVRGQVAARLATTYTAVFSVAGRPGTVPLTGTALVPGPDVPVTVREARSELIAG